MKTSACLLTSIPVPYRERVHELVHQRLNGGYMVVYCREKEGNRYWQVKTGEYPNAFLACRAVRIGGHTVYLPGRIGRILDDLDPEVVISGRLGPVYLRAFGWTRRRRRAWVSMTDGWLGSEGNLGMLHRLARRLIIPRSSACIGASLRSLDFFRHYGAAEESLFRSCLCTGSVNGTSPPLEARPYHCMFSGQFIERKMPFFFCGVMEKLARQIPDLKVLILGAGPLETEFRRRLQPLPGVEFGGFRPQADLPASYASARLFFFPTEREPWGVVANEACAAGAPVLTCDTAGAAHELIRHGENGLVLPLDEEVWAGEALRLLHDPGRWQSFSRRGRELAGQYTPEAAAEGICRAVEYARRRFCDGAVSGREHPAGR